MKHFVLGFLFNKDLRKVLLIQKKRYPKNCPEMKGRWNGIGGHVEKGEFNFEAMTREAEEEIGRSDLEWEPFCHLTDNKHFKMEVFYAVDNQNDIKFKQKEDEILRIFKLFSNTYEVGEEHIEYFGYMDIMPNLKWLIPMAINKILGLEKTDFYRIEEF